jgi:allantoicase
MDHLLIDLASYDLGGRALEASDESLGPKERLVATEPPRLPEPGARQRDGWETRRRRDGGHDWVIVRLGLRGILRRLVVDTSTFAGDEPEACSLEAIDLPGKPNIVELVRDRDRWFEALPRVPIDHGPNEFNLPSDLPATHVRLVLYPDGGVARLRCHGEPVPSPGPCGSDRILDVAAITSGGRVVDCSSPGATSPNRMLGEPAGGPGGWLTPRRRRPGHEWAVIRLAGAATLDRIEVDTSGFAGEAPDACAVEGMLAGGVVPETLRTEAWETVVPPSAVASDRHTVWSDLASPGPFSHLRLSVLPDGGVAAFRAYGRCEEPWTS